MVKRSSIFNLLLMLVILLVVDSPSAYAMYAEFTFDMDYQCFEIPLPLYFEENGVAFQAYSDSIYWRQTDLFTDFFTGLSGGVLTNGVRLGLYPGEALNLEFTSNLTNFSANFSIVSIQSSAFSIGLVAYSGEIEVQRIEKTEVANGLFALASTTPFNRIMFYSSDNVDFAIDNVRINSVPLPISFVLMLIPTALMIYSRMYHDLNAVTKS